MSDAAVVAVGLGDRSYEVRIGAGLLAGAGDAIEEAMGGGFGRCLVVIDTGAAAHAAALVESLRARGTVVTEVEVEPSETDKSLETFARLVTAAANAELERGDPVIAVGGGIVGDIAGFAAASYRRGVPVVQCPTTLLSMVDASVGGKTGVNLMTPGRGLLKNMVGAFHQPVLVLADTATLGTLPERVLRSGMAECLKHGMLSGDHGDADYLDWIVDRLDAIYALDAEVVGELVERSVRLKAEVVAGDERELDRNAGRATLNLGHTFAHAMETLPGLTHSDGVEGLQHGEAVALGLIAAATTACEIGLITEEEVERRRAAVAAAGLPTAVSGLPGDSVLLGRMASDKKVAGGQLRLVLPTGRASARVFEGVAADAIESGLAAVRI